MQPRRILIPTDFSEASKPALVRGLDLAAQNDAEAHVLHVIPTTDSQLVVPIFDIPPQKEPSAKTLARAEKALAERVGAVTGSEDNPRLAVLESAYVPHGIVQYAIDEEIDLVVMGTHGRRGARRFFLGSVAEEIVRKSPCPVLTVGADERPEPVRPKKILGAVDLEEGTQDVVNAVKRLAELYHSEMSFVHVVPPINHLAYTRYMEPIAIDRSETAAQAENHMREHMKEFGITQDDADLLIAQGIPDAEIVELARKHDVDMIVVATHSRVGLPHVLLGSVADRVIRTAECPVLTLLGGARKQPPS